MGDLFQHCPLAGGGHLLVEGDLKWLRNVLLPALHDCQSPLVHKLSHFLLLDCTVEEATTRLNECTRWILIRGDEGDGDCSSKIGALCFDTRDPGTNLFAGPKQAGLLTDPAHWRSERPPRNENDADSAAIKFTAAALKHAIFVGDGDASTHPLESDVLVKSTPLSIQKAVLEACVTDNFPLRSNSLNEFLVLRGSPWPQSDVARGAATEAANTVLASKGVCFDLLNNCSDQDIDLIDSTWDYRSSESRKSIEECVRSRPCACLRRNDTGAMVCWMLIRVDGSFGILYTVPDFRRQSLARSLVQLMMNQRSVDEPPFLYVSLDNPEAKSFWGSMGFQPLSEPIYWIRLQYKKR